MPLSSDPRAAARQRANLKKGPVTHGASSERRLGHSGLSMLRSCALIFSPDLLLIVS